MKSIIVFLIIGTLFITCGSYKNAFHKSGGSIQAINNAILDFSHKGKLNKKGNVFSVSIIDTFKRMILIKSDRSNYKWTFGKAYNLIIGVSIIQTSGFYFTTNNIKMGKNSNLPTRYVEIDEKLFFWWDSDYSLTEQTLRIFKKYHLLQEVEGGKIHFPEIWTDDSQKAAHYYFCRNDLTKYKRIDTNKGMGYYDSPNLKCN